MLLGSNLASNITTVKKFWRNSFIILMKNQYLLSIWLKWLNFFLNLTILSLIQMWNIKYLEQLLELRLSHHMHVYIWPTWRISFSKMNKFSLVQFRCIVNIFFIWTASESELGDFLERLNNFHPDLNFTNEPSRQEINFLDHILRVNQYEFITNLYCKLKDGH